jgi:hypothetical protein
MNFIFYLVPVAYVGLVLWAIIQTGLRLRNGSARPNTASLVTSILWFAGAFLAIWASYRTGTRAFTCGDFSLPPFSARDAFFIFLSPCILWSLVTLGVWSTSPTKVGAVVAVCFWLWMVSQTAISNEVIKYTPCDKKGDESGQGLAFAAIYLVPMVWATTSMLVVLTRPSWRFVKGRWRTR